MNDKVLDLNHRLKRYSTTLYHQVQKRLQNQADSSDLQIGIWGTTGAGKTTYFARLYQALAQSPDWIVERNGAAYDYLGPVLEELESGNLPLPTRIQDDLKIHEYRLAGQAEPFQGINVTLSFIDAPGEFYENPLQGIKKIEKQMDILDYLGNCHGIIFLLDPDRDSGLRKLGPLLRSLMEEFQKRSQTQHQDKVARRLQQYMAFCVTKVDQAKLWEEAKNPEAQVKRILGSQMYAELKNNFCINGRYKFYPVSAIGRYQQGEDWISVMHDPTSPTSTDFGTEPPMHQLPDSTPSPEPLQKPWELFSTNFIFTQPTEQSEPASDQVEPAYTKETVVDLKANDDSYAGWNQSEPLLPSEPVQRSMFDVDKEPVPVNVTAPIEWLIESIRANPPVLNGLTTMK